jgi:hypothetical protein
MHKKKFKKNVCQKIYNYIIPFLNYIFFKKCNNYKKKEKVSLSDSASKEVLFIIDVLEVNEDMRRHGLGGNIVSIIESVAETYYPTISVSPFDTDAINFWEHMKYYKEENYSNWVKKL